MTYLLNILTIFLRIMVLQSSVAYLICMIILFIFEEKYSYRTRANVERVILVLVVCTIILLISISVLEYIVFGRLDILDINNIVLNIIIFILRFSKYENYMRSCKEK